LGGKKPNAFTIGGASSSFDNSSFGAGKLSITRLFAGLGTALKFPDDFFTSTTTLNIENINLENYFNQFLVSDGKFKNFNISQTFSRSSIANPMFPMGGSRISLLIQFTPPYSLFRKDNFWKLTEEERQSAINAELTTLGRRAADNFDSDGFINDIEEARRFEYLEYHKWRFDAEWYYNITGKLVLMTSAKMGFLGKYNSNVGDVPFERFQVGGDGLSNQSASIQGTDIIALRGYEEEDVAPNNNRTGGGTIFNKFTTELRYPLSTNPNSTIYTGVFFQAGNQWSSFDDYNPFDLRRSVGLSVRVFLPMFGLLGFDYGFGLDKTISGNPNPGLGALGKFSIVLGFEPD
jgi:outer membrane protein insertion porin family